MENFIKVYPNVISDKVCDYIIKCFEKYESRPGKVGGGEIELNVKNSADLNLLEHSYQHDHLLKMGVSIQKDQVLYDEPLDKIIIPEIYKAMRTCLTKYNKAHPISSVGPTSIWPDDVTDFDVWQHFHDVVTVDTRAILCKKYDKGKGYFNWHMDKGHNNCRSQNRAFITMFYCNDVEKGGETEWKYFDIKVKPKKGSVVVFPADWAWLHRGNMPVSDDKYICNIWWCFRSPYLAQEMSKDVPHWSIDDLYLP